MLGLAGGLGLALLRIYGPRAVRAAGASPISTCSAPFPLLVLLVLIYYALPFVGIRLSPFAAATAALSLVSCAYAAEIFRAGIEAVPQRPVRGAPGAGPHTGGR